jgi:hypothetical protein
MLNIWTSRPNVINWTIKSSKFPISASLFAKSYIINWFDPVLLPEIVARTEYCGTKLEPIIGKI